MDRKAYAYQGRHWSVEDDIGWATLDVSLVVPIIRRALGRTYAQILEAERLGLSLVGRLLEAAPEGALRDAARIQYEEETRHIAFFERLSALLGVEVAASPALAALNRELLGKRDYRTLMLELQVLENAAHATFVDNGRQSLRLMHRGVRLPGTSVVEALLRVVTGLVGKDEARHVAFGMRVLRSQFASISARELHVAEERVQMVCARVHEAFTELEGSFRYLGFERGEVLDRLAASQLRYFRHLGIAPRCPSFAEQPAGRGASSAGHCGT